MKISHNKKIVTALVTFFILGLTWQVIALAATTPTLGTAKTFAILANNLSKQGPQSKTITGDLGYTSSSGFGTAPTVSGTTYISPNSTYTQAGAAQATALTALNNQACDVNLPANVDLSTYNAGSGVGVYTPKVYCTPTSPASSASIGAAGITLSGSGTYIFRISGSLTTALNSHVSLQNSASACDVFWTTGLSAAISMFGGGSTFVGTLIEPNAVSMSENVTWTGRILAYNAGVSIASFDHITAPTACTIPSDLHVIKVVDNAYGGTAVPGDFNLHVKLAGVDVTNSPSAGQASPGKLYSLAAGTYVVSEDAHAGYTATYGGDCTADGHVTLIGAVSDSQSVLVASTGPILAIAGSGKTCTVTNHQTPPADNLHVIKVVKNTYGGTAVPGDFSLHVKHLDVEVPNSPAHGMPAPGKGYSLVAGTYTVSEDPIYGYTATFSGDCNPDGNVVVPLGSDKTTCIVTNNQTPPIPAPARLHVIKVFYNDFGGTAVPSDAMVHVKNGAGDVVNSPLPGSATGTTYILDPGTYTISEDPFPGYTAIYGNDACDFSGNITLAGGDDKTCTISNDQNPPETTLYVIKKFYNNFGGTAIPSDAIIHVENGAGDVNGSPHVGSASPGTFYELNAGTYTVIENPFPGYITTYSGDCSRSGNVTLALGENKTCMVTNEQNPPAYATLHVIKNVINDDGGTAIPSDFNLYVKNGGSFGLVNVTNSPKPGISGLGRAYTLTPDTYNVSEDNYSGYTQSFSGDCDSSGNITLGSGDDSTCTITNDDNKKPTPPFTFLHVIKKVINNDSGTANETNFMINVKLGSSQVTGSPHAGSPAPGTLYTLLAGAYTVSENAFSGYTQSFSGDCNSSGEVILVSGDDKTCTVINDDNPNTQTNYAVLNVIKHVINDNGGTSVAPDFTMHVAGTNVSSPSFLGAETITTITLDAGTYGVTETGPAGYTETNSINCSGTIAWGETKTCTITNDDIAGAFTPAKLHVIKNVINDDGGTAIFSDFNLHVKSGGSFGLVDVANSPKPGVSGLGRSYTLTPDTYNVSEDVYSGYSQSFSGDCDSSGNITLSSGSDKTCTITNDDDKKPVIPFAFLHVIKTVINNDGGTTTETSFMINVKLGNTQVSGSPKAGAPAPGTLYTLLAGTYVVSENAFTGYTQSFSGDCDVNGKVILVSGDDKTCTVINDDNPTSHINTSTTSPVLHIIKKVINDNGGTSTPSSFIINVKLGNSQVIGSPATGVGSPGRSYTLAVGTYTVSENIFLGYDQSFSGDCDSNGKVTLALNDDKTCTVINNDNPVSIITTTTYTPPTTTTIDTTTTSTTTTPPSTTDSSSVITPPSGTNSSASIPKLPNTGVAPLEKNIPKNISWNIVILIATIMLVSTSLIIARK